MYKRAIDLSDLKSLAIPVGLPTAGAAIGALSTVTLGRKRNRTKTQLIMDLLQNSALGGLAGGGLAAAYGGGKMLLNSSKIKNLPGKASADYLVGVDS